MNNKGQALVVFVILLPVLFLFFALVIDLGDLLLTKQKYQNEVKSTIKYGLNHIENENLKQELQTLLNKNIDINPTIEINDNIIKITVKTSKASFYKKITKKDYDINFTYIGYKENDKIIIKKE